MSPSGPYDGTHARNPMARRSGLLLAAVVLALRHLDLAAGHGPRRRLPQPRPQRWCQGALVPVRRLLPVPRRLRLRDRPRRNDAGDRRAPRRHGAAGADGPDPRSGQHALAGARTREATRARSAPTSTGPGGNRFLADVPPPATTDPQWYTRDVTDVAAAFGVDVEAGLTTSEVTARRGRFGRTRSRAEKPPSVWAVALGQLRDPMNIMLVAVTVGELRDRRGLDGDHRGAADPAQRRARLAAGAEGAGERRRAVEPAGAAGEGRARRRARARAGGRRRSRRHRPARGGRHRPRRRSHHPLGDARDAGGGAHRRERPGRQGRRRARRAATSRSATARTCCSRTPR